ncbi:MAG TPA: RNA methyltransferase [Desulfobacteraceae bacterium]|nr:RNA methyltransferase [Desulfobacteraceae bacterium]
MRLYIGLVHYPVYNKNHETIASAISTWDLHDIARVARTYDARQFIVITPLEDQKDLAEKVVRHWTEGYGANYNIHRKEAIELVSVVSSLSLAMDAISEIERERPLLIATDASEWKERLASFEQTRNIINEGKAVFLIFGTAWGLDKEVLAQADYVLEPIWGRKTYNHLSVRSAAAIILDRLAGRS